MKIGESIILDREITLNEGRATVTISVTNAGDRPVQVDHIATSSRLTSFLTSTEKRLTDIVLIFLQEMLFVLSQVKLRKFSYVNLAEQREFSV